MRRLHRRTAEVVQQIPVRPAMRVGARRSGALVARLARRTTTSVTRSGTPYRVGDALKNSEVPTLLIGGWRDAFLDQTLEQYDALRGRGVDVALTVGPWTHMETATKAAGHVTREALEWLDHCFADGPARPSRVRAFVTGTDEWRAVDDWTAARRRSSCALPRTGSSTAAMTVGRRRSCSTRLIPRRR